MAYAVSKFVIYTGMYITGSQQAVFCSLQWDMLLVYMHRSLELMGAALDKTADNSVTLALEECRLAVTRTDSAGVETCDNLITVRLIGSG